MKDERFTLTLPCPLSGSYPSLWPSQRPRVNGALVGMMLRFEGKGPTMKVGPLGGAGKDGGGVELRDGVSKCFDSVGI